MDADFSTAESLESKVDRALHEPSIAQACSLDPCIDGNWCLEMVQVPKAGSMPADLYTTRLQSALLMELVLGCPAGSEMWLPRNPSCLQGHLPQGILTLGVRTLLKALQEPVHKASATWACHDCLWHHCSQARALALSGSSQTLGSLAPADGKEATEICPDRHGQKG